MKPSEPTVDDVLALMPIVAWRGWHLTAIGAIRDPRGVSPLFALAEEIWGTGYWRLSWSESLGVGRPVTEIIILAAHNDAFCAPAKQHAVNRVRLKLLDILQPRADYGD